MWRTGHDGLNLKAGGRTHTWLPLRRVQEGGCHLARKVAYSVELHILPRYKLKHFGFSRQRGEAPSRVGGPRHAKVRMLYRPTFG